MGACTVIVEVTDPPVGTVTLAGLNVVVMLPLVDCEARDTLPENPWMPRIVRVDVALMP
jgi:hypothetical protein